MPADKPPMHPGAAARREGGGTDSVRSNAGQDSVTRRTGDLVRVSLARVSAAVSELAREVVEPPTQHVPVGAKASELAPLKTAEEGTKAEEQPLQLSTLSHDADEDGEELCFCFSLFFSFVFRLSLSLSLSPLSHYRKKPELI